MQIARVGDVVVGTCCCHSNPPCIGVTGMIASGSPLSSASGLSIGRMGDVVIFSCGHTGVIVSGSPMSTADGLGIARIGDVTAGCVVGTIVSGDPLSSADG